MQQAIPYGNGFFPIPTIKTSTSTATTTTVLSSTTTQSPPPDSFLQKLVRENAVIVFGRRGCCMCHVVKLLMLGLGVNPTIYDVDEELEAELSKIISEGGGGGGGEGVRQLHFPAVFVGGKVLGGLEKVMATHISGELVPILKDAGALWL